MNAMKFTNMRMEGNGHSRHLVGESYMFIEAWKQSNGVEWAFGILASCCLSAVMRNLVIKQLKLKRVTRHLILSA